MPCRPDRPLPPAPRRIWTMAVPAAAVMVCSVAVGAAAGPIYSLSERTATDLLGRDRAIAEVLDR